MKIFDADIHWIETEKELLEIAGINRPRVMPRDGWDRTLNGKFPEVKPSNKEFQAFLSENNITKAAVHPTRCMSIGMIQEQEVAIKIVEAYHIYTMNKVKEISEEILIPISLALPQNIEYTTSKLEQYKNMGFKGIMLLPHGHKELFGSSKYMEFFKKCQDLNFTVTIHANSFGALGTSEYSRFSEVHALSFPFENIRQFISMSLSGVFEKFKNLNIAFLESGVGWLPYWIDRLDDEYIKRSEELPIKQLPSKTIRESNMFISCSEYEKSIEEVNNMIGGGVMWQSDYPHWDYVDNKTLIEIQRNIKPELIEEIRWSNAVKCYQ